MIWRGVGLFFLLIFVVSCRGVFAQARQDSPWIGAVAGVIRTPNSNQPGDDQNTYGEALSWVGYRLYDTGRSRLALYSHAFVSADSNRAPYNNVNKVGIGLRYRFKLSKAVTLTFSARHDWDERRRTGHRRQGMRYAVDGFIFKYWSADRDETRIGLPVTARILKAYATLETPGSLRAGDDNLVLTFGGELSEKMRLPNTDLRLALFADVAGAWDLDQNNYNNKLIPAVGIKVEYPLEGGVIYAGARMRADWRWIRGTVDVAPGLVIGWFRAF